MHTAIRNILKISFVLVCAAALLPITPKVACASDDVATALVQRDAEIARTAPKAGDEATREKLMAEIERGSIEIVSDPKHEETRIDAEFTVDGEDAKDVKRREQVVKLYAERTADGTIVVQPVFPGKWMARDSVKLTIRVPATGDCALKSGNGTLVVRGTSGSLRVATKNGSINVSGHTGSIDATSANGTITIEGATDGVRATSANGAIRVTLASGNDHPFDIEAKNALVMVEVGSDFDGAVRITTSSGTIAVVDPAKRVRTPDIADHSMTAEIGAATGHSIIETTSGGITLSVRES